MLDHLTSNRPSDVSTDRLRIALLMNLLCQALIIVTGGLVRLTGSGLGCPTWPQCTPGSFTPVSHQAQGWHVFVEFGNRLLTFVLLAVTVWVLVEVVRKYWRQDTTEDPQFIRWSLVPLAGVLAQAVVGGITVLTKLDPRTVSPHFLLSAALVAFSAWLIVRYDEGPSVQHVPVSPLIRRVAVFTGIAFAAVVTLGTAVTGSGPHSGDAAEPVRFGFDPVTTSRLHAAAVWIFVGCVLLVLFLGRRHQQSTIKPTDTSPGSIPASPLLRWWSLVLIIALAEGAVGYLQYARQLPIGLVAVHLLISAVLIATVTFAVTASRTAVPLSVDHPLTTDESAPASGVHHP
ncbi:Heme A synthase [Austwickia sp. TVS 96-490-7B]|uniref:COX15/CtaA family protein n=1 Tax=Austwickia sp. TVS 96-490-7B TaxID=2830843 RepID=UPI001DAEAD0E|nr:COX15/CtaA family protein [Austwickia sp. TVS 96-490-7B]MBW3087033.1 Heme A synthase [Austwickia sp. TVS 96-490-7B]